MVLHSGRFDAVTFNMKRLDVCQGNPLFTGIEILGCYFHFRQAL